MPEGPTVYLLRSLLKPFEGRTVQSVRGNSKAGIQVIDKQVITEIKSWGKHLLIVLSNNITIKIHFLLFGSYSINEKKENRKERLGLDFDRGEINFYACSVKLLEGDIEAIYDWSADVMNDLWDDESALQKILSRPSEQICDILLDQQIFSGVGNIIKNEVLFRQRTDPRSIIENIPIEILHGITDDARAYSFQFLAWKKEYVLKKNYLVHTKKICPVCFDKLTKEHLGKTNRRSFYCNNCQKKW